MSYRPRSNDGDNVRRLRDALAAEARPEVDRYLELLELDLQGRRRWAEDLGLIPRHRIPAAAFDVETAVLGPVRHELDYLSPKPTTTKRGNHNQ